MERTLFNEVMEADEAVRKFGGRVVRADRLHEMLQAAYSIQSAIEPWVYIPENRPTNPFEGKDFIEKVRENVELIYSGSTSFSTPRKEAIFNLLNSVDEEIQKQNYMAASFWLHSVFTELIKYITMSTTGQPIRV